MGTQQQAPPIHQSSTVSGLLYRAQSHPRMGSLLSPYGTSYWSST